MYASVITSQSKMYVCRFVTTFSAKVQSNMTGKDATSLVGNGAVAPMDSQSIISQLGHYCFSVQWCEPLW